MKLSNIMSAAGRNLSIAKLKIVKRSPELLLIAGIAGGVTSAVMACKATTKVSEILDSTSEAVNTIHQVEENPPTGSGYTHEDAQKDLFITYMQTGAKLAKLYGPSLVVGGLSVAAILASNNILRKRNVALAAAFSTVSKSFEEYRGRVIEKYGKEADNQLRMGVHEEVVQEIVSDDMGNEKQISKTVKVANPLGSPYAKLFDESNPNWEKNPEYSLMFLKSRQQFANDKLRSQGYLFLNDVLDSLSIPRCKEGQIVGWVYKGGEGDDFVDFGLNEDTDDEWVRYFMEGDERSVWLDFNVQGNILDLI